MAAIEKAAAERGVVFVKGTDFLLEGGESSLRDRLFGRAAGADRGGHRAHRGGPRSEVAGERRRPAGVTGLELARPRDISALFADALGVYFRNAEPSSPLSAAVVVPVHLVVEGVGMEELTAGYDSSPSPVETAIPTLVSFLVVAPLINAICIHALHDVAAGERPRARAADHRGPRVVRADLLRGRALAGIGDRARPGAARAARASTSPCAGTSFPRQS